MTQPNEGLFEEIKNSLIKDLEEYEEKRRKRNEWQKFLSSLGLWDNELTFKKRQLVKSELNHLKPKAYHKEPEIDFEIVMKENTSRENSPSQQPNLSDPTWREVATFRDIYKTLRHKNCKLDKEIPHWRGFSNNQLKKILKKHAEKIDQLVASYREKNPAEGSFDSAREHLLKELKKGYLKSRQDGFWVWLFYKAELTEKRKQIAKDLIQILEKYKGVNDWQTAYCVYREFHQKFQENKELSRKYHKEGGRLDQLFEKHKGQFNVMKKIWTQTGELAKIRQQKELDRIYYYIEYQKQKKDTLVTEIKDQLNKLMDDPNKRITERFQQEETRELASQYKIEWTKPSLSGNLDNLIEENRIDRLCNDFILSGNFFNMFDINEAKDLLYKEYKKTRFKDELDLASIGFAAQLDLYYKVPLYSELFNTENRKIFVDNINKAKSLAEFQSALGGVAKEFKDINVIGDIKELDTVLCTILSKYQGVSLVKIKTSTVLETVFPNFLKAVNEKNVKHVPASQKDVFKDFEKHQIDWLVKQVEIAAEILSISLQKEQKIKQQIDDKLSVIFEPRNQPTLKIK